jgi:hypothetical protein
MSSHFRAAAAVLLLAALPQVSIAAERRADPADPDAPVPSLSYQSAFSAYRKAGAGEPRDWRGANDAVREAGGHAGALQDASAPPQSPQPEPAQHRMPMSHGMHGAHQHPAMPSMPMQPGDMHGHQHGHRHGQQKETQP